MAKNLGDGVSHSFETEGYNYSSVVFQAGKPPLDAEVNLMQELQEQLTRRATSGDASGWFSYREAYAERGIENAFYTQNPTGAVSEIALVNGWPLVVTNTNTVEPKVNLIDMSEFPLTTGARVDGVFLEVWRGLIDDQTSGITTPTDLTKIGVLRTVFAIDGTDKNVAWAGGDDGILIKTDNGGVTWLSQPTPTSSAINAIHFQSTQIGYIAGDNGTLYKTADAGVNWTKIDLPVVDNINDISVIDDSFVVLVGDSGSILRSTDGATFNLVLNTDRTTADLNSVDFYDSAIGWACGSDGAYIRTLDGGQTWSLIPILVPDSSNVLLETKVVNKLNSISFVNLNDGIIVGDEGMILRTTDGGLRWSNVSESIYDPDAESPSLAYRSVTNNLNKMQVVNSYPVRIELSIYDTARFSSASYVIGPKELVLTYISTETGTIYTERLILAEYATDSALVAAINAITSQVGGYRVFQASLSYTETNYTSHENSGSFYGSNSTEIKFSMGDRAWIVGDDGLALFTENGGARWTVQETATTFNLYGIHFPESSYGWLVGDQGEISGYRSDRTPNWQDQDTDLVRQIQRKVYFEGNNSSPAQKNLTSNVIHPDVRVETSARVQLQYRIRVVEGVDIDNFRDAGLGSAYIFSKGPNGSVRDAGSYTFTNMGTINGDYGCWRANCRNTVDGFSYAIPMFLVTRRNQQPYDAGSNVNGSSVDSLDAIRPDGLVYEDIVAEDIIDIRRKTGVSDYTTLLKSSLDMALTGNLRTSVRRDSARGGQAGSLLTYVDDYSTDNLASLATGAISSRAIGGISVLPEGTDNTGYIVPGASGPADIIQFPLQASGLYNHDPDYYSATYVDTSGSSEDLEGKQIPGHFTGLGTTRALFVFDKGATGYSQENVSYNIQGAYINYGSKGLSKSPQIPLSVKNTSQTPADTLNYSGILNGVEAQTTFKLTTGIPGYTDYVETTASNFGGTTLNNSSMLRAHFYQEITQNTSQIRINKNNEGYFIYAVREIRNLEDGGIYRVASMLDRDGTDTNTIVINLATSYTVTEGSFLEIIAEVTTSEDATVRDDIGQESSSAGESIIAYRNPYVSVYNKEIKSVSGFYKSVIIEQDLSTEIYLDTILAGDNANNTFLGISTMNTLEGLEQPYIWFKETSGSAYKTLPVKLVNEDGNYKLDLSGASTDGLFSGGEPGLIVLLLQVGQLSNNTAAQVSYKSLVPQTVQPLPSTMEIELVAGPDYMIVSPLGTGGGYESPVFSYPLEQVPTFDNQTNESFFFNLYGLEFQTYLETEGLLTLPMRVANRPSGVLTLSNPGADGNGRTFYREVSSPMVFKAEPLTLGNPRKLIVPMLGIVKGDVTNPLLRGEVVLVLVTSYENTTLANEVRMGATSSRAIIGIYKVPSMPLIR